MIFIYTTILLTESRHTIFQSGYNASIIYRGNPIKEYGEEVKWFYNSVITPAIFLPDR